MTTKGGEELEDHDRERGSAGRQLPEGDLILSPLLRLGWTQTFGASTQQRRRAPISSAEARRICFHHPMGVSGSDHSELRRCIAAGQYASAIAAAHSLPVVPLDAALDLTMLAAEKDPDRYEEMARRWLVRWITETGPGLPEIALTIGHLRARKRPPGPDGTEGP